MPTSNPVYQPTTVTYERHSPDRKEWSSNYFTETVIPSCYQKPYLQRLLLVSTILLAILGLSLAIFALVNDVNTHKDDPENEPMPTFDDNSEEDFEKEDATDPNRDGSHDHQMNVVLGSIGICLVLIALVMYVMFLQLRGMCRGLLPTHHSPRSVSNLPPRQPAHGDGSPTAISYKGVQQDPGALNLEPAAPAEEERHSLMDNKFASEDTERMMDDDPRIVLKPLRTAEEA